MLTMCFTQNLILVVIISASILDIYCTKVLRLKHKLNNEKIVGGSETTIQKYPYQAYLSLTQAGTGDNYQCGGSIINKHCILTAAHCVNGFVSVNVRVGSTKNSDGGYTYNSKLLVKHPKYNPVTTDYDIGLIKVLRPIKIDGQNTTSAKLPDSACNVASGTNLTVTGWGATQENGSTTATLRKVTVDDVSFKKCKTIYPNLTARMICAGVPEGGKDSCQGDSGGPLIKTKTETQLGIVSNGTGCARPGIPGIYTNLCNPDIQRWLRLMNCF